MSILETTIKEHRWKPLEEYKPNVQDVENLTGMGVGSRADVIKKLSSNQFIVLRSNGTVEKYNLIIESLRKEGLDIGKGDCEYGWKMPIEKGKRELRIFRR